MTSPPDCYAEFCHTARVRERALFEAPRIPSELELQARWFAGDFGKHFVSTAGDKIDIVQFGTWNREAGPDFRDAAIQITGGEPVRGCIEIDLLDRNWETHGHATNPAFEATVLHVFVERSDREFFTRTLSNRNVPQVCIDPASLPEVFTTHLPLARPGRCQAPLFSSPFSHSACRCGCCGKMFATARHCSSARPVSWRFPTSSFTKNRLVNMCDSYGTVGGRIAMNCEDSSCRLKPGDLAARAQ